MDELYLVAGLGNPGREYALTRHNAGFLAIEELGRRCKAEWKSEPKFEARVARVGIGSQKVILCEPQTYMNSSGEAVAGLMQFFKILPAKLLVLVDDADLPFGSLRLRGEGSSGGHHGLESIEEHIGTRGYARLKIGIGRLESGVREITGHVLGRFSAADKPLLEKVLERAASQAECWLTAGLQVAMNKFNGAVDAPVQKEKK